MNTQVGPVVEWESRAILRRVLGRLGEDLVMAAFPAYLRADDALAYTIDAASGRWPWRGALSSAGYGVEERAAAPLTGVAYERFVGPVPVGHVLHHTCRNHGCVNPDHLEPLTSADHTRLHAQERAASRPRTRTPS